MTVQIRKFTPSLHDGATLERLYVERDGLLDSIVERVAAAGNGDGIGHTLVVGPRGAGKTHLISLVHHRVQSADATRRIAWMVEDPYLLLSYHDLVEAIIQRSAPPIDVLGQTTAHYEAAIRTSARQHGPVVVLAENFDEILDQLGDLDQQHFRRLIESERCLQLVVTTTAISQDLADQPAPFYGFFNQARLRPFTTSEEIEYLTRRAAVTGDDALAQLDAHPELTERRVRALEQLAGGQPRIWAMLSQGLTLERLDGLVDYLIDNFDDITPYYQAMLKGLAPLQRRIVLTMAEQDRALSAKSLSTLLDTPPATITKTLRDLDGRGWVREVSSPLLRYVDGRLTYYELAEPMLRLALEIKDTTRNEIRLVLDFVKLWFDRDQIAASPNAYALRALAELGPDDADNASRWMLSLPTADTPSLRLLGDIFDAVWALRERDADAMFELPSALRRSIETQLGDGDDDVLMEQLLTLSGHALGAAGWVATDETAEWLDRHQLLFEVAPTEHALTLLAWWLGINARFESAELALRQISAPEVALVVRLVVAFSSEAAGHGDGLERLQAAGELAAEELGDHEPVLELLEQLLEVLRTIRSD